MYKKRRYFNEDARSDHNKSRDWAKWAEETFEPTKAWIVARHKALNSQYFSGKLTTPDLEAKKLPAANGHRTFGWWWVHQQPAPYERDRKGRIIPSSVGKREERFELALNTMFKGDDFFWESILLHEMCHQAVYELSDPTELAAVLEKDKTGGHHQLWLEWADKVTMDKKHVVTRYSDYKQEANMLSFLPDMTNIVVQFEAAGKFGICACNKRYMDGVIGTIMTTIFPEKLNVYENKDPMFLSMRQSHRAVDYRVKDAETKQYIEDMFIVSGEDSVFYYEWNAVKDTPAMKLIATEVDYASPEYTWLVFEFESGQKGICKMPPGAVGAWRGIIELDSEDDYSVMKCEINLMDFGSYRPFNKSTVRIRSIECLKTYGAPRQFVEMSFVKMSTTKDSYGRPMITFNLTAVPSEDVEKLKSEYNGAVDPDKNKDYFCKVGKKYAERTEEQWGVLLWRNEGEEDWYGWTVRAIHQGKIMQCIRMTQNAEEGLSLVFANEKDLDYFNAYTELPQLRNYNVKMQDKDMLDMSEWAYDSVPGTTNKKTIDQALGVSAILKKEEWSSNIAQNKKRFADWAGKLKLCVLWHNKHNKMFYTPTLDNHKKFIKTMFAACKDPLYKPVGEATIYGITNQKFIELTKITGDRTINHQYFAPPIYRESETKGDYFLSLCDKFEIDPDEEMAYTSEHWWSEHVGKPYTGSTIWKEIACESLDDGVFDTLGGLQLTDAGVEYIRTNGTVIETFNL